MLNRTLVTRWRGDENYVFSDTEYEELLRTHRRLEREKNAHLHAPSQTSGAGPSGIRHNSRVSIEEVEDEGEPTHIMVSSDDERREQLSPRDKGKGKESDSRRNKRRSKPRTSLGLIIDEVKPEPDISYTERERTRSESRPSVRVPDIFRSGGYAQAAYGRENPDRRSGSRVEPERSDRTSGNASRRLSQSRPSRSERSRSRTRHSRSTNVSRRSHRSPSPHESPSGSEGGGSDDERSDDDHSSDGESETTVVRGRNADRRLMKEIRKLKEQNKKLQTKIENTTRAGAKPQTPKVYKGEEPDIEVYEQFMFDFNAWAKEAGLTRSEKVQKVCRFLDGKAARWYMSSIAPNLDKVRYEMKDIYSLMYQYCFPPDYKEKIRKKYEDMHQGSKNVQDFFAELDLYRTRLNDVTDTQHVRRAWNGAARYIRAEWAMKGIRPENTTFEELKRIALDIEYAYNYKRSGDNDHGRKDNHKRDRSRSPNRKRDNRGGGNNRQFTSSGNQGSSNHQNSGHNSNSRGHGRDRTDNWKKSKQNGNVNGSHQAVNKLTEEEKEKLKAEGKCLHCKQFGHFARNCPKVNKAKPTGVKVNAATVCTTETKVLASSALLQELDRLSILENNINLSSVEIDTCMAQVQSGGKKAKETQGYIERNSVRVRDNTRRVPQAIIVQAKLNGQSVRVLLDSGSQADIVSTTIVDQLNLDKVVLTKPLQLVLAISGSKGVVNYAARARLQYQGIDEERDFDVGNLGSYDVILGTPWLYQHCVSLSFNPMGVSIGSVVALPLEGDNVIEINSVATDVFEDRLEDLRQILRQEAEELCPESVASTPLPPFRAINHVIPLKV